ncbi:MAG: hypothetical protein QM484_12225 [Woeseiaceae bacterium]
MTNIVSSSTVGTHMGKRIYASIELDGLKYDFDRMGECDIEGCHLQQLVRNEVMLPGGIIYKKAA